MRSAHETHTRNTEQAYYNNKRLNFLGWKGELIHIIFLDLAGKTIMFVVSSFFYEKNKEKLVSRKRFEENNLT